MNQNSSQIEQMSPLQRSFLVIEKLKSKLNKLEYAQSEPIAIIGMSCRFPGQANDPEKFWQLLARGGDGVSEIPRDRWDVDNYYDQNPNSPGKMYTKFGGFLEGIDKFDPLFFRISPKEALSIDPQHRLLLEVTWEALENAGNIPERLSGSLTGVFVGITLNDYGKIVKQGKPSKNLEPYGVTGLPLNAAAGRISYTFGFTGPCMSIDTACSSSLVAIHQACQSLRANECDMALAGGVNLILVPDSMIATSKAKMLSVDGRCKTFDETADGMGRGEGCGMIVLKRLSDAEAQGDSILALIRGSAVNQDGPSSGLTVPNGSSQERVMRQALAMAKIDPADVNYIEAHGTGTPLGDPIELRSIAKVYAKAHSQAQPLVIGSAKTNLSHIETAAGVAATIKVVLQLQHKQIAPHLHFKEPTPNFNWDNYPISIPNQLMPWQVNQQSRLAGINSFGASGTNVHLVLEEAPTTVRTHSSTNTKKRPVHLLTLSAKNLKALAELINRYHNHLATHPELSIADICYTANTGRKHFKHRLVVIASNQEELAEKLFSFNQGKEVTRLFSGQVASNTSSLKTAFFFSGQGCQYLNMGRQLYQTQPVFRQTLDQCAQILQRYLEKPLLEVIYPENKTAEDIENALLNQTSYTQPALFAIEYALYKLWSSWGIKPNLVMGHSVGEYVAATVAGVFSLEDTLKLIAHRGRLMQQLPSGGGMLSVMASFEKVNQLIAPYRAEVAIAAINGPETVVISGAAEAIGKVRNSLEAEGIKTKQLKVSHAFHSPLMEPMLAEFEAVANQITYHAPKIALISNVTGTRADESIATASYWVNHVRQPVQFAPSVASLHQEGYEIFLEIGPKPILLGMARQCLPEGVGVYLPSLRENQADWAQMLQSLAELYVRGVKVDWLGFDRDYARHKLILPTYPFQRQRYWIETSQQENQPRESSRASKTTSIVDCLDQGNTSQLAQQLEQTGQFSTEQINLLPELLEILATEHRRQLTAVTVKDWLYKIEWKTLDDNQSQTSTQAGHWLVFADTQVVGEKLAQKLQQQGCECSLVYRGESYENIGSDSYKVNPNKPQEFEQLIQAIDERSNLPLQKVIHLWGLDVPNTQDLTPTALDQAQIWGCGTILHLVQALSKTNNIPQLWLVTRGAQAVSSATEEVAVAASPLWGMGRVISLEYPQLWGGMVDLDPQAPESETASLLQLLGKNNQREDHLAFRGEYTYKARLVKQPPTDDQLGSLKSHATYLITGGLGALGLQIATWMVAKGARNLVLTGRKQPSAKAQQTIEQLHKAGAQVLILCSDISQRDDTIKILSEIEASLPTLKGIIHAAGLLDDGLLQQMNWKQFTRVMAPKVQGAWHLHSLTENLPLDFFVCFSSIASLVGSPGQGNYAAANAFMDALAHHRRGMGLSGLSINWGPWAEAGMTANLDSRHQDRIMSKGLIPLSSEQGLQVLEQLLEKSCSQVGVLPVEWPRFLAQFNVDHQVSLLADLVSESELRQETKPTKTKEPKLLQQLESLPKRDRYNVLITHIQTEVTKQLGLDSSELIDLDVGFVDLGMDSLMAVEFKNQLQNQLGTPLPATLAIEYPTIRKLSQYLAEEVMGWSSSQDGNDSTKIEDKQADVLSEIEKLSEDDLEASIAQKLVKLEMLIEGEQK